MRSPMKCVNNLPRYLALLLTPLLLINCGREQEDPVFVSSGSRFEDVLEITPDSYLPVTTADSASIEGYTDWTGKMPDDRCHMTFSPETEKLSGIHITWSNQTTGQRGAASLHSFWSNDPVFGYMCKIQWFADVPLEPGENVIKLHITDPWGKYSDEFVTITRILSAPAGVAAKSGDGQNIITWNEVTAATHYTIYWSAEPVVSPENATAIRNVTSPYTHSALTNTATYYYVVTAGAGENIESAASQQVRATPLKPLASGLKNPLNIVVDSLYAYWTEYNGSAVKKISLDGGPVTLLTPYYYTGKPVGIAMDAVNVYWTNYYGSVNKINLSTGTWTILSRSLYFYVRPSSIAVDANYAYWCMTNDNTGGWGIYKTSLNWGGEFFEISDDLKGPVGFVLDSEYLYYRQSGNGSDGNIKKVSITSSLTYPPVITLASHLSFNNFIAIDDAYVYVYWTEASGGGRNGGVIKKVGKNGGEPIVIASSPSNPGAIATDETFVYWAEYYDGGINGAIKKVAKNGGPVMTLATGLSQPSSLAVDTTSVYWVDYLGGTVMMINKN